MSCIWNLFSKKEKLPKRKPTDSRVQNPLNQDVAYADKLTLESMEAALLQNLVSLHYKLEEAKERVRIEFQKGSSPAAKEALARRTLLAERKKLLETRLKNVQEKLQEIKAAK